MRTVETHVNPLHLKASRSFYRQQGKLHRHHRFFKIKKSLIPEKRQQPCKHTRM